MISSLVGITHNAVRLSDAWNVDSPLTASFATGIDDDSELFQTFTNGGADPVSLFADAAGKDDRVGTAKRDQHPAQVSTDLLHKHVQSEP